MNFRIATLGLAAATLASLPTLSDAQDAFLPASGIYRLNPKTTFDEGCQPPCKCAIFPADSVRGTYRLTPLSFTQFSTQFAIDDINWVISTGGEEQRVTGSGTYTRSFFVVDPMANPTHSMSLQLSFDGEKPVQFDSGVVDDKGGFPNIDIALAMNDFYCFDQVFGISSSPVSIFDIQPYTLVRSKFQQGCFPPCLCPLFIEQRLTGTFGLVPLSQQGTFEEYAVVNVNWTIGHGPGPLAGKVTGFGTLTRISGFAGFIDRLQLDLKMPDSPAQHFDSGFVNETIAFPKLNLTVSANGMVCADQVYTIRAKPSPFLIPIPNPIPPFVSLVE